jgi:hypothetical protein
MQNRIRGSGWLIHKTLSLDVKAHIHVNLPDQELVKTFIPQKATWKEGAARDSSV